MTSGRGSRRSSGYASSTRNPYYDAKGKLLSKSAAQKKLPTSTAEDTLAIAALKTANKKVGNCYVTSAGQESCPNGSNSSYTCPFLNKGCYAESGPQGVTTDRLNSNGARASSLEIAKAEADALNKLNDYLQTYEGGPSKPLRLHIVGDAVTTEAVQVLEEASRPFIRKNDFQQGIVNGAKGVTKVWAYTHGWRDVPRSAWGDISILASCETVEDMQAAHDRGYAVAAVVTAYRGTEKWKPFESGGFKILPCPEEAKPKAEKPQCHECGFCLRDKSLRSSKTVIAFISETSTKTKAATTLIQIGANI
jgi:hypothetical protein